MPKYKHYIICILGHFIGLCGIFGNNASAQCNSIDFKANVTKGCPLLVVKFTATGGATGTTYQWDFGNGFTKGDDTTTKAFSVPGKYTVKLLATLPGKTSPCPVIQKDTFITVYPVPTPQVAITPGLLVCDVTQPVYFSDNTPGVVSRYWIINGTKDTANTIGYTFPSAGLQPVTLFVTNKYSCNSSVTESMRLYDSIPVGVNAIFTATSANTKAVFGPYINNTGTSTVTDYTWSFPGGSYVYSNLENPFPVTYTNIKKKYDVILTVRFNNGCIYTADKKGYVYPFLNPQFKNECTNITFNVLGDTGELPRSKYQFYFPGAVDSTVVQFQNVIYGGNYGTLRYPAPGKYTGLFSYFENGGDSIAVFYPDYINIIGPGAEFTSSDNHLCKVSDTAHFINETDTTNSPNTKYTWYIFDSLDRNLITGNNKIGPTNQYNNSYSPDFGGAFGVSMVATSSDGCKDSINIPSFIVLVQPKSNFKDVPPLQCFGNSLRIIPAPIPAESNGDNYYKYRWAVHNEADPHPPDTVATPSPPYGPDDNFTPPSLGIYDVNLKVLNGHCIADTMKKAEFKVIGDSTSINLSQYEGCLTPDFTIEASLGAEHIYPNDPNNPPQYTWITSPSTGVLIYSANHDSARITFTKPGCYNVYMQVQTTLGSFVCNQIITAFKSVCVGAQVYYHSRLDNLPPTPLGCLGNPVPFMNISDILNGVSGFRWSVYPQGAATFIPSDSATNVSISFKKDTCYTVTLTGSRKISGATCFNSWTENGFCYKSVVPDFITTSPTLYCQPGVAKFKSASSANAKSFLWYFGDGDSLFVGDTSTVYHAYQHFTQAAYDVTLIAYDGNGCASKPITKKGFIKITGPIPLFTMDKKIGCDSVTVNFTNTSINVKKFSFVDDDNDPPNTVSLPSHKYILTNPDSDSHIFTPSLQALDDPTCKPFFIDTIKVYRTPTDTKITYDVSRGCAPFTVHFNAISRPANGWKWDFYNDGIIEDSTHQNPVFTYTKAGRYVVRLMATNHGQCPFTVYSDTITVKPNAFPGFVPSQKKFCGPADVHFKNTTRDAARFAFDYGDGSPLDSNVISIHKYYFNPGIDTGTAVYFFPKLIAIDSNGCSDSLTDTLVSYQVPTSGFRYSNPNGCDPHAVQFVDTSKNGHKAKWDFDNNGTIDTTGSPVKHLYYTGLYTVKMIETSINGCVDSTVKVNLVTVNPIPIADFNVSDSDICKKDTIWFQNMTEPADSVVSWLWSFDEPGAAYDTSSKKDPSFIFYTSGVHTITLTATDNKGCSSTISKNAVYVEKDAIPINTSLLYVTVLNKDSVQIAWRKSNITLFGSYIINLLIGSNKVIIDTIKNRNDTVAVYGDSGVNTSGSSYCFSLQTTDRCGNVSYGSYEHCTILLSGTQNAQPANVLTWTGYSGWIPDGYDVFRAGSDGVYKLLDSVALGGLTYTDSNICDDNYCYYIEAYNKSLGVYSRSNIICLKDQYIHDIVQMNMQYATVLNNSVIQLKWDSSTYKNLVGYQLDKYSKNTGWVDKYAFTHTSTYTDNNVRINDSSYAYRVRTMDKCGYPGPESNIGTSILLQQNISNDNISLKWNGYQNWSAGVQNYLVQVQLKDRQFKTVANLPGTDTTYTDDSVYNAIDTAYCYRVIAFVNGTTHDSSVSNLTCAVLPTRMFVPNAFSPNGDKLNDEWKVSAISVYNIVGDKLRQFDMKIYNRWGTLVFETNDIHKGWDGTFLGAKADADVYIYLISAEGITNKNFQVTGNLTLIR